MENYYFYTTKMCAGYDHQPVVSEIEIALGRGEILTLIGPNGAGKSTVLKSIAGQLQDFDRISDGQKQRVMLARAICQEPEIVVLDEPTSYLDIRYKLEFLSILQEMRKKRGLTVIMSLHELELARIISDKILCLKGDYAEKYGTPEEIFAPGFIERLFDINEENFRADEKLLTAELGPNSQATGRDGQI